MLTNITYFNIFGKPLIMYIGIFTLLSMIITALIPVLKKKNGTRLIPFKWHSRMAIVSIIFAVLHGILGILIYV
jgi:hypothetical protein